MRVIKLGFISAIVAGSVFAAAAKHDRESDEEDSPRPTKRVRFVIEEEEDEASLQIEDRIKQAVLQQAEDTLDMDLETARLQKQKELICARISLMESQIEFAELAKRMGCMSHSMPKRYKKPFNKKTGVLTVSDRKIYINGPIVSGSSDRFSDTLDFWNNQSSKDPIFVMVDSPGGSVIEGLAMISAMKASKAPVHVVVKRFAASMAAVITAVAKKSYALPNALILFHEPSTMAMGNTSAHRESVSFLHELEKRLVSDDLLEQLGYETIEEWREDLYKNSKSGDWMEFGDKGQSLRWVKHVAKAVKDTSISVLPGYNLLTGKVEDYDDQAEGAEDTGPSPLDLDFRKAS